VEWGIIPDNTDLFVGIFFQEPLDGFKDFITILPWHLVEMTDIGFLV
jgi:hypothetical protein